MQLEFRSASVPYQESNEFISNLLVTSKYTALNFFPLALREQFERIANIYFVVVIAGMAIGTYSNLFASVFDPWSTLGPFVTILGISMARQAMSDLARHRDDSNINGRPAHRIVAVEDLPETHPLHGQDHGERAFVLEEIAWRDVRVGDRLVVRGREELPADVLAVATSESHGACHVETSNIDGETNLKLRQAPHALHSLVTGERNEEEEEEEGEGVEAPTPSTPNIRSAMRDEEEEEGFLAPPLDAMVDQAGRLIAGAMTYQQPTDDMHQMEGTLTIGAREPIVMEPRMVLLRGSMLRNCDWVICVALYTGTDTRVAKKVQSGRTKTSRMEALMNRLVRIIFFCYFATVTASTVIASVASDDVGNLRYISPDGESNLSDLPTWMSDWFGYFILYSNFVPISLYVTVEVVYALQTWLIEVDVDMYDDESSTPCRARTANLNTDLGQIEYLFSDKTGTLTQNKMEFRACSIGGKLAWNGTAPEAVVRRPSNLLNPTLAAAVPLSLRQTAVRYCGHIAPGVSPDRRAEEDREHGAVVEAFLFNMALNNTILTTDGPRVSSGAGLDLPKAGMSEERSPYIAESPDELALVQAAAEAGAQLIRRAHKTAVVYWQGLAQKWRLLHVVEFSSERKRMSLLAQSQSGQFVLMVKGADNVMLDRAAPLEPGSPAHRRVERMKRHLELYATRGLRTLVLGQREVSADQATDWMRSVARANRDPSTRKDKLRELAADMERDLDILGCTAIEDKLQDDVANTIFSLRTAGIKVWVLTGDKMETAINIGHSSKLLTSDMRLITISAARQDAASLHAHVESQLSEVARLVGERKAHRRRQSASGRLMSKMGLRRGPSFDKESPSSDVDAQKDATASPAVASPGKPQHPAVMPSSSEPGPTKASTSSREVEMVPIVSKDSPTRTDDPRADARQPEGKGDEDGHETASDQPVETTDVDGTQLERSPSLRGSEKNHLLGGVALAIDGPSLAVMLADDELRALFFVSVTGLSSVIACRASPQQKRRLVAFIKSTVSPTPLTLAIGDGANDVGMINEADVGVGIAGHEGLQAANSSDFSIAQFRFLKRLLLLHGRWSYVRMSKVLLFSVWKNLLLTCIVFAFSFLNNLSGTSPFETLMYTGFNVFSGAIIFAFGMSDRDLSEETCLGTPQVYVSGRRNLELNRRAMAWWVGSAFAFCLIIFGSWLGTYESGISTHALDGQADGLQVFGSSLYVSLLLAVHGRCATMTHTWSWPIVLVNVLSIASFFLFFIFRSNDTVFSSHFYGVSNTLMAQGTFWMYVFFTVVTCMAFDLAASVIKREFASSPLDVIRMKESKGSQVSTQ